MIPIEHISQSGVKNYLRTFESIVKNSTIMFSVLHFFSFHSYVGRRSKKRWQSFFKLIGAAPAAEEETGIEDHYRQALGVVDSGYVDTQNTLCIFNSLSTTI